MKGVDGPLKDAAEKVLTMKPNFSYTLQEVEDEVAHVFELGWFAKCQPNAEDTRDGVKLTIEVTCLATHLMQTLFRRMLIIQCFPHLELCHAINAVHSSPTPPVLMACKQSQIGCSIHPNLGMYHIVSLMASMQGVCIMQEAVHALALFRNLAPCRALPELTSPDFSTG